ncbi:unnamed protein product [Pipistrellus nathusii]|uniref:Uncharacterized protein n=1 Tax=Pipistrellus nathusii TaxID=59473 RepID=A0ABP0ALN7_PIPNA
MPTPHPRHHLMTSEPHALPEAQLQMPSHWGLGLQRGWGRHGDTSTESMTETTVSLIAFKLGCVSPNKVFLCFYSSMETSLSGLAGVAQWLIHEIRGLWFNSQRLHPQ